MLARMPPATPLAMANAPASAHVSAKVSQTFSFTLAGADNVSSDGTSFEVTLQRPIIIPNDAVACEAGVISASIWNNSPNIGPDLELEG